MKYGDWLAFFFASLVIISGCGKSDDRKSTPQPNPPIVDNAPQSVALETSAVTPNHSAEQVESTEPLATEPVVVIAEIRDAAAEDTASRPRETIRIATYNINYGLSRFPDTNFSAMRSTKADILFLQETNDDWETVIRRELSADYPVMLFRNDRFAGGMAIVSKFPVTDKKWHLPQGGWFYSWIVTIETNIGLIQCVGVHLKPSINRDGKISFSSLVEGLSIRESEIKELYNLLDDSLPTIILGDFNENELGPSVQCLIQKGYKDALSQFDANSHTWQWTVRDSFVLSDRLDHIMVSDSFRCVNASVIHQGHSDHFPVIAVLEMNESAGQ
ncbi:MAG: endonuclease/exonuclease/phosphatase family protein [Planctomycetota bacterium]